MAPMLKEDFSPPNLDLDRNFAFQMASIIFRLEQDLRDSSLRQLDITYMHFRVLQYLLEEDGKKIGEVAKAIVARPPVLSRVIDQMEQRELVRRTPDPADSRLTRVYLTQVGRDKYAQAWPAAHKIINYALEVLTPEEQDSLARCLKKLGNHVCS